MENLSFLDSLNHEYQDIYNKRNVILTFDDFLNLVSTNPRNYIRNSIQYIADTFDYFGKETENNSIPRFKVFDIGTERNGKIVGGEIVQNEIYDIMQSFIKQGFPNKLILLHGPNGSAKTSTVETISNAMKIYSEQDEGAVYRFNWIFPSDKNMTPTRGESSTIGFSHTQEHAGRFGKSFALLEEEKISSKISSDFKENPIFLIPPAQRKKWLRDIIAKKEGISPEEVELPQHILLPGLSKRNQEIFESLLNAYNGNISNVFRHIQIERFYYSRQYRVGISTVEPQMSIDAREKQLTLDKNISNLPSVLSTINFHQAQGEIVEANRGILEFSDLLKRPLEAFKYLLSTVEKCSVNMPTGVVNLDLVFIATTNEKHLDAFKQSPDFSSFKGRFELVTVPYLMKPSLEKEIYKSDIKVLTKTIEIAPHSIYLLSMWASMTRLKQPDPELYPEKFRNIIKRLTPLLKVKLYEEQNLRPDFTSEEAQIIESMRIDIANESRGTIFYEGRFGASPREIRSIIQKAAQNCKESILTPMDIFHELEILVKDKTVYEFLQFEPRGEYHNPALYVTQIKQEFIQEFEREAIQSMTMVDDLEYENLLNRYITHVVGEIKKEKIRDEMTNSYIAPSNKIMEEIEKILGVTTGESQRHRESMLSKIAAYKLENPEKSIEVNKIFYNSLQKIKSHFYNEKKEKIDKNFKNMLLVNTEDEKTLNNEDIEIARSTFSELESKFGYSQKATLKCLKYYLSNKQK